MSLLDFTIEHSDLKVLFMHTGSAYDSITFDNWTENVKNSYIEYHTRNTNNLERYGNPKTFSQWINGQIIALT